MGSIVVGLAARIFQKKEVVIQLSSGRICFAPRISTATSLGWPFTLPKAPAIAPSEPLLAQPSVTPSVPRLVPRERCRNCPSMGAGS